MKETIKFLVMDVDGTLTDGKIYMGSDGEAMKAFNIKDGCGIALLLPKYNITPVIITARESKILENRCKELNITELHQGSKDKLQTLKDILKTRSEGTDEIDVTDGTDSMNGMNTVAYIGDDLPDLAVMNAVKGAGGIVLCPSDAIQQIKDIADYISAYKAGEGAVRDCIDYILKIGKQCSQESSKNIATESVESPYPSASLFLDCVKDEYEKERDRMQNLDTKAAWFMYAILFMVTIFVPVIPFAELRNVFSSGDDWQKGITCCVAMVLLFALWKLFYAFRELYDAYKPKDINRFKVEITENVKWLKSPRSIIERAVCDHYRKAIKANIEINNSKVEKINNGLKQSAWGIFILAISAMILVACIGK